MLGNNFIITIILRIFCNFSLLSSERKGIIAPIHDQETGYRYYTTWDLHMLIRARCYLGFGLSIEETAGILQSKSLEEIDDLLEEQEQIIQKNIIYQMNLLKRLRTNRKLISRSENLNFTLQKRYVILL